MSVTVGTHRDVLRLRRDVLGLPRLRREVLRLRCEPCIVKGGDVDTVNNADPSECRAPDLPPEPSDGCSAPEPASLPRAGQLLSPPGFACHLPGCACHLPELAAGLAIKRIVF